MDFKPQFENIEKLEKQLEELNKLQNNAFSKLDPESYEKVKEIHRDVNDMMRKIKQGDMKGLEEYLQKYTR